MIARQQALLMNNSTEKKTLKHKGCNYCLNLQDKTRDRVHRNNAGRGCNRTLEKTLDLCRLQKRACSAVYLPFHDCEVAHCRNPSISCYKDVLNDLDYLNIVLSVDLKSQILPNKLFKSCRGIFIFLTSGQSSRDSSHVNEDLLLCFNTARPCTTRSCCTLIKQGSTQSVVLSMEEKKGKAQIQWQLQLCQDSIQERDLAKDRRTETCEEYFLWDTKGRTHLTATVTL